MYPIMGYNYVCTDIYFNIERKAITMAIRTASTTARSSSHSTQSAPKKPSSAQRSGSASRSSAQTQSSRHLPYQGVTHSPVQLRQQSRHRQRHRQQSRTQQPKQAVPRLLPKPSQPKLQAKQNVIRSSFLRRL